MFKLLIVLFRGDNKTGVPSKKDDYFKFLRVWNGKVYSAANSKFLYVGRDQRHLYKHSSGDYFWVWIPLYEEWGYQIDTKDRAKEYIISHICNENLEYSTDLLKTEFNIILEDNPCIEILRAKKIKKIKFRI